MLKQSPQKFILKTESLTDLCLGTSCDDIKRFTVFI